jgi:hypothetical protein
MPRSFLVLSLITLFACEPRDGVSKFTTDTGSECVDGFYDLDIPNAGYREGKTDAACQSAVFYGHTLRSSSPCISLGGVTPGRLQNDPSNTTYTLDGCFGLQMTNAGETYAAAKGHLGSFEIAENTADLYGLNYYETEDDYWCEDGTVVVESKLLAFDLTFIGLMRDEKRMEHPFETCGAVGGYGETYEDSPWQAMDLWLVQGEYDVSLSPQENIALNQTLATGTLVRVR